MVAPDETNDEKLINMILQTKQRVKEQGLSELVQMFIRTAKHGQHHKTTASHVYDTIAEEF